MKGAEEGRKIRQNNRGKEEVMENGKKMNGFAGRKNRH